MKKLFTLASLAAALSLSTAAFADDGSYDRDRQSDRDRGGRHHRHRGDDDDARPAQPTTIATAVAESRKGKLTMQVDNAARGSELVLVVGNKLDIRSVRVNYTSGRSEMQKISGSDDRIELGRARGIESITVKYQRSTWRAAVGGVTLQLLAMPDGAR